MQHNRTTCRRWLGAALSAGAAIAVVLAPATAGATPTSSADAARLVAEAGQQLTGLEEQVHQARLTVEQHQQTAAAAAQDAAGAQAAVDAFAPQLRAIAQSASTSQSRLAAFLTGASAADVVQQMTTLDLLASHTEGLLAEVGAAQTAAAQAQAAAAEAAAQATAALAALEQQQAEVQARMDAYEADLARLSAADRATVATTLAGPSLPPPSAPAAPSEAAGAIISAALAQVGKPYVWGSSGPGGFDCSGLTSFAYRAAGRALPHSSQAQSRMGVPVSRSELQPGDIVYFYAPVSHVGIYIGDGRMVHARTFGVPVAVTSVDMRGYAGARRIL
ncbi:C40 family peptidase [Geodermatophilus ruber]|uniref:Cell wall-associated hydrolase, NlpC family n=1 Tax=Geodermatophilus ruber TaxID=504800 RepID=A0A1I3ZDY3_9ACTN|nr:C40 family peptidase [Geodermatophilus ruber]SFK42100.1 Cell wall-associated hydrolase, NlpC family [Geodermatophilus ruber]